MRKVEPEEFQAVDEQIILREVKSDNIIQKNSQKWGFKNLVCVGSSGLIYGFDVFIVERTI